MLSSILLALLASCAALTSAENSVDLKLKTSLSSFLRATPIDNCTYKISTIGEPGFGTRFNVYDVQNINNATIRAPTVDPNAVLDLYQVRDGGAETAQVFLRTNLTEDAFRATQQISIADAHLSYYSYGFNYVFYCEFPPTGGKYYTNERHSMRDSTCDGGVCGEYANAVHEEELCLFAGGVSGYLYRCYAAGDWSEVRED